MSFILDALKKSESERQRQTIPGLVDTAPVRGRQRLPVWAIALGVLLAVNLVVLAVVLLRSLLAPAAGVTAAAAPVPAPVAAATTTAQSPVSAAGAAPAFSPMDAAPQYAPEIPVANAPPPASATGSATSAQPAAADARPARRHDPVLSDQDSHAEDEVLPTINEISLSGAQALPELHLDVHVYATRPADRFVYINMRKYHEGAVLQEGPTVDRIRRDGVVLAYQGVRFLLPRQ